jgi:hypothetical protein
VGEVVATLVLSYNRSHGLTVIADIALHHNDEDATWKKNNPFANVMVAG